MLGGSRIAGVDPSVRQVQARTDNLRLGTTGLDLRNIILGMTNESWGAALLVSPNPSDLPFGRKPASLEPSRSVACDRGKLMATVQCPLVAIPGIELFLKG